MPYADPEQRRAFAARNYVAHREELIAYQEAYRAANPEKCAARSAAYHAANKDSISAKHAAYYVANKERMNTAGAAYHAAHKDDAGYKEVRRASGAAWRAVNKDKTAAYRAANYSPAQHRALKLKQKYGLTVEDFDTLAARQGGACVLCGRAQGTGRAGVLHVDHCHDCEGIDRRGSVRGLLCGPCNRGLTAASFDPDYLRRALAYSERHSAVCPARLIPAKRAAA